MCRFRNVACISNEAAESGAGAFASDSAGDREPTMDLNSSISILILGFLVLVFGSILRRRATDQLQYWFFGWVLLLVHLLAGLVGERIGAAADHFGLRVAMTVPLIAALVVVSLAGNLGRRSDVAAMPAPARR